MKTIKNTPGMPKIVFSPAILIMLLLPAVKAEGAWYRDYECWTGSEGRLGPYSSSSDCMSRSSSDLDSRCGKPPALEFNSWDSSCYESGGGSGGEGVGSGGGGLFSHFFSEPQLNDSVLGKPFFTTHMSSEFSDWLKESRLRWQAYLELSRKLKPAGKTAATPVKKGETVIPPPPVASSIPDKVSKDFYVEYDLQASRYFYDLQMRKTGVSKQEKRNEPKVPTEEESEQALLQKLTALRRQLDAVKASLVSLQKINRQNTKQYEEWEAVMNDAMDDAQRRGEQMLVDESFAVFSACISRQLVNTNNQIFAAGNNRERLKILEENRESILKAQEILENGETAAKALALGVDAYEFSKAADKGAYNPNNFKLDRETGEKIYDTVNKTFDDEGIQVVIGISSKVGKFAKYAKSIVDSSYNLAQEYYSWQNIKQLRSSSEQFLDSANKMNTKIENIMSQIKDTENKLGKYRK